MSRTKKVWEWAVAKSYSPFAQKLALLIVCSVIFAANAFAAESITTAVDKFTDVGRGLVDALTGGFVKMALVLAMVAAFIVFLWKKDSDTMKRNMLIIMIVAGGIFLSSSILGAVMGTGTNADLKTFMK